MFGAAISGILLLALCTIAFGYLYVGIRDLYIFFHNFNLPRAEYCRWNSCGLFYFDPQRRVSRCLNPLVSVREFQKRSRGQNAPGCRWSVAAVPERTPFMQKDDYLAYYQAFRGEGMWWRIISIIMGILLLHLGVVEGKEWLSLLF